MIKTETSWVGVNTGLPNKLVVELFENRPLKHWQQFNRYQSEVKINDKSRIDLVLWNESDHPDIKKWSAKNLAAPLHLIEIKNVTLAENGLALFPDAVTERGLKHLHELMTLVKQGFTCEMVYVVQRTDCKSFKAADHIDPAYAKALKQAADAGVVVTALPCNLDKNEVTLLEKAIPVTL